MDAYDLIIDKYRAEKRFQTEIKEQLAREKSIREKRIRECNGKHDGSGDEYVGHGHNYNVYKCSVCGEEYDY